MLVYQEGCFEIDGAQELSPNEAPRRHTSGTTLIDQTTEEKWQRSITSVRK